MNKSFTHALRVGLRKMSVPFDSTKHGSNVPQLFETSASLRQDRANAPLSCEVCSVCEKACFSCKTPSLRHSASRKKENYRSKEQQRELVLSCLRTYWKHVERETGSTRQILARRKLKHAQAVKCLCSMSWLERVEMQFNTQQAFINSIKFYITCRQTCSIQFTN